MSGIRSAFLCMLLVTTVLGLNLKNVFGMRRAQLARPGRISTQLSSMGIDRGGLGSVNNSPILSRSRTSSHDSLPYNKLRGTDLQKPLYRRIMSALGKATFQAGVGSAAIAGGSVLAHKLTNEPQNQTVVLSFSLPDPIPADSATHATLPENQSNGTTSTYPQSSSTKTTAAETAATDGSAAGLDKHSIMILGVSGGVGLVLMAVVCVILVLVLKKFKKTTDNGIDIEMQ